MHRSHFAEILGPRLFAVPALCTSGVHPYLSLCVPSSWGYIVPPLLSVVWKLSGERTCMQNLSFAVSLYSVRLCSQSRFLKQGRTYLKGGDSHLKLGFMGGWVVHQSRWSEGISSRLFNLDKNGRENREMKNAMGKPEVNFSNKRLL